MDTEKKKFTSSISTLFSYKQNKKSLLKCIGSLTNAFIQRILCPMKFVRHPKKQKFKRRQSDFGALMHFFPLSAYCNIGPVKWFYK